MADNRIPLPDGEHIDVQYTGGGVPGSTNRVAPVGQPQPPHNPNPPQVTPHAQGRSINPGARIEPGQPVQRVNQPQQQQPANVRTEPVPTDGTPAQVHVEHTDGTVERIAGMEAGTVVTTPGAPLDAEPQPGIVGDMPVPPSLPVARISGNRLLVGDRELPTDTLAAPVRIEHYGHDDEFVALTLTYLVRRVDADANGAALLVEDVPHHEVEGGCVCQLPGKTAVAVDLFNRTRQHLRRFVLQRNRDVTGVSGTGVVAEGVQLTDGRTVLRWLGDRSSIVLWDSLDKALAVHGHDGATRLRWLDVPTKGAPKHPDSPAQPQA